MHSQIAKYQAAFLNRQFINIMCANGVPHELIIGIFEDAIADIKGFRDRVWNDAITENDEQLIALCNDVSRCNAPSIPSDCGND